MQSAPRNDFSDQYLQAYANEHLWYEIWMFLDTGTMLPFGVSSPRHQVLENAVLESFAIHLRNLLDFFYPSKFRHNDDVLAEHYFDSGKLPTNFPKKTSLLDAAETRAHKQVSHLTAARLSGGDPEKAWDSVPLMKEMIERIVAFNNCASREKLGEEFMDRIKQLLSGRVDLAAISDTCE